MTVLKHEKLPIRTPVDIVVVRKEVRSLAVQIGLGLTDQTKVVTAASELARNTLDYGEGGEVIIESLKSTEDRIGIRMTFEDKGPGIADLELALTDGYTTGRGLGMGLSGSKRLMSEFEVQSEIGKGTRVTATKWK